MRLTPNGPGNCRVDVEPGDRVTVVDAAGRLLTSVQTVPESGEVIWKATWSSPKRSDHSYWAVVDAADRVLFIAPDSSGAVYPGMELHAEFPVAVSALSATDRAWLRSHGWTG